MTGGCSVRWGVVGVMTGGGRSEEGFGEVRKIFGMAGACSV